MAKKKPAALDTKGTWPVCKLTIQPELLEAIKASLEPRQSVQTAIIKIVAAAYGIEPRIRAVGNPEGRPHSKRVKKPE